MKEQLNSFQRHLISLCRRSALHFKDEPGKLCHWTKTHVRWIQEKVSSLPAGSLKNNLNFLMMQITELRESIDQLKEIYIQIKRENELLKAQQSGLVSQKAELVRKNEAVKDKVNSILERIRNIEIT